MDHHIGCLALICRHFAQHYTAAIYMDAKTFSECSLCSFKLVHTGYNTGEVGKSWGFDLIRIQFPHPPGNIRNQIPPSCMGIDRGFEGHIG